MYLELDRLSKQFDGKYAVHDLSLGLEEGGLLCILGSSGCGKTTTLNMIGGFLKPDGGRVLLDGQDITALPPERRPVSTVFQSYGLFPHMSVLQNVTYGLKFRGYSRTEAKEKGRRYLSLVGLAERENARIGELSGGQQQRVALARALIVEPKLCLLDEPLSNLDAALRVRMRGELKRLQRELGTTMVFVTHDQEEALTMSDKIVVMNAGEIQQIGTPIDIYNEPINSFVADFIGDSNIIGATMIRDRLVEILGARFDCVDTGFGENKPVDVVIRPEDVELVSPEEGILQGTLIHSIFKGVHYEITVQSGKNEIVIQSTKSAKVGDMVGLNVEPDGIHVMPAEKALNRIETGVDKYYKLEFLDGELECDLSKIVPSSHYEDGVLMDASGDVIDHERLKVILTIKPDDITMSDDQEEGIISGHIINLIYKGDHYSYVVRTENEEDFIVHDEYLWNMDDFVSLVIPKDKIHFELKK